MNEEEIFKGFWLRGQPGWKGKNDIRFEVRTTEDQWITFPLEAQAKMFLAVANNEDELYPNGLGGDATLEFFIKARYEGLAAAMAYLRSGSAMPKNTEYIRYLRRAK